MLLVVTIIAIGSMGVGAALTLEVVRKDTADKIIMKGVGWLVAFGGALAWINAQPL